MFLRVICHIKEPLKNTWQLQCVQGCTLVDLNGTSQPTGESSWKFVSEKHEKNTDVPALSQTNTIYYYLQILNIKILN